MRCSLADDLGSIGTELREWAVGRIRAGRRVGDLPRFGDEQWLRLDDVDRRKIAAVVVAALCWYTESRPQYLAQRIADELAAQAVVDAREFAAVAARVRRMADRPTWADVQRRWHR
jgi:hypothetical protein